MRENRWAVRIAALLVAGAAAVKVTDASKLASDLAALLGRAGLPAIAPGVAESAAWALVAFEVLVAIAIVVPRSSKAGLASLLAVVAAGVVLVGVASDWGVASDVPCPCGITFMAPFLHSPFAMLLLRDACIVALVALAWGRTPAPQPSASDGGS
jgi:hypothetical protein